MAESVERCQVFSGAFKLDAIAAIQGGGPVSQVSAELGSPDRLVWCRHAGLRVACQRRQAPCVRRVILLTEGARFIGFHSL